MIIQEHDPAALGAYLLGALTDEETRTVERHLAECARCRKEVAGLESMQDTLGEVPPELFLDGPPDDADLLLQRTLRQMRTDTAGHDLRRRILTAVAASTVAAAALGIGVLVGRTGDTPHTIAQPPPPTSTTAGTRTATATDSATGARMTVTLTPTAAGVQLSASVKGIPVGEHCQLWVVTKDRTTEQAGGWVVTDKGKAVPGSAAVAVEDVAAVEVKNTDGEHFVSVTF